MISPRYLSFDNMVPVIARLVGTDEEKVLKALQRLSTEGPMAITIDDFIKWLKEEK